MSEHARIRWRQAPPELLVFALAVAVRVALVIRSGGFLGNYGYDSGVYYASADALIHGRLPYRDFVLLHPPALMLALTPAALIGRLTTDHIGFLSASVGMTLVGALNAALVVVIGRRLGLATRNAVIGGVFYATWFGSASAEYLPRLEPLGNLFLLTGLFAITVATSGDRDAEPGRPGLRWLPLATAGAAFGLAASVKIWFTVPLVIVALWLIGRRRTVRPTAFLVGAAASAVIVDGPFLLLSRGVMWSRVVLDQIGRSDSHVPVMTRLAQLTSVERATHRLGSAAAPAIVIVTGSLFAVALALAWRRPRVRLVVLLALGQLGVLIAAPSWFGFYADFAAAPVSLSLAAAADALPRRAHSTAWIPVIGTATVTSLVLILGSFHATASWRGAGRLIHAVAGLPCVMSDAPNGQIELNALDRNLANGCPNWVDVTGRSYFGADRAHVPRRQNRTWQRDLVSYLRSGDAVFLVRKAGDGMTAATLRSVARGGVLAANRYYCVYRGGHPSRGSSLNGRVRQPRSP